MIAYSPTKSGKTYCLRGGKGDCFDGEGGGIVSLALDDVFQRSIKNNDDNNDDGKDVIFHLSYLRIYCDTIQDLLLERDKEDCAGDGDTGKTIIDGANDGRFVMAGAVRSSFLTYKP